MTSSSEQLGFGRWDPAGEERLVQEAIRLSGADAATMKASIREVRDGLESAIVGCNHRLRVLTDWISRGLVIEAASVEAVNGGMCRSAVRLMFREQRLPWDKACASAGIRPNSAISEQAIETLDRGLSAAHKASSAAEALQVAVLGREPLLTRVKRLRSLFMLMPQNEAIKGLVRKYERDSVLEMDGAIREAIAQQDAATMESAIETIDGLQWQSQFSADLTTELRNALKALADERSTAEFSRLASAAVEALDKRDLYRLGQLEDEVAEARRDFGAEPDDETRRRMQPAWEWLEAERGRMRSESQHAQATAALREALDQGAPWPEIEPIRAKVLEPQLGIPEDVDARCYTLEQEWKAAKRRANLRWIGVSCVVAVVVLAGIGWFVHESSRRQLANEESARISGMVDRLEFAEARRTLEALAVSDPALLDRAQLQAVQKRVDDDEPTFNARRDAVRALLDAAERTRQDTTATEAALQDQQGKLDEAIALEGLSRMVQEETVQAKALRRAVADSITARRTEADQRRREAFSELRRKSLAIPLFEARAPEDRVSPDATKVYQTALTALQVEVEAFKAACPASAPERAEAEALLNRVSKDLLSAEEQQVRLKKFEEARAHVVAVPVSGESWADAANRIRGEFEDILKARGLRELEALDAIIALAKPAQQVDEWRERVLPALSSRSPSSAIEIPSNQQKAKEVRDTLELYVRNSPESPFRAAAARWAALASIAAVQLAAHPSISAAIENELRERGLMDLRQVAMGKGARTGGFVFVKDLGAGSPGIIDHLVRELGDLAEDPASLSGDMNLRDKAVLAQGRMTVPFVESLSRTLGKLANRSVVQVQGDWLRMVNEIASSTKATDPVARAAVALGMLRVYLEVLSTCAATPAPFCGKADRVLHDYEDVEQADWPRLAIESAKAMSKRAESAIKAMAGLGLVAEADRLGAEWRAEVKSSAGVRLVGILPVAELGIARKTVPSKLTGPHYILVRDPAGADRWLLAPVTITDGALPREFESITTTLIYADH